MQTHIEGRHVEKIIVDHDKMVIYIYFTDGSATEVLYSKERLILKGVQVDEEE